MKNKKGIKTILGLASSLLFATTSLVSAKAWGPERATFTMENPATYPTFNSITDNPSIGDERDFVRVGQINADVTQLSDSVEIKPGHQYLVYIYFHNNASASYNYSEHNHSGIALGTRMSTSFPTILDKGENGTITGTITANNSNPASVWDEAYLTTSSKVYIHYVAGSAKIYDDWPTNESILPDTLFTKEGTLIGLTSLNGAIPGCEEYHGVVSYVIQADSLEATVDKTVSIDGENFSNKVDAKPGDEVTYKLTIKNMGTKELSNVTVKDSFPDKVTLVPGSVQLWANESTKKDTLPDNIITNGYNLGTLGTGNTVYITYRAKISEDIDCGSLNLTNTASLTHDTETSEGKTTNDKAVIVVEKDGCTPPPEDCTTNPDLPECQDCSTNPDLPGCKEDCTTNPNLPECQRIPDTGPVEIILAIIIVLGLGGAGYYYYRTQKKVKSVENKVSGKPGKSDKKDATPENPVQIADKDQSPKPENKEPKADK